MIEAVRLYKMDCDEPIGGGVDLEERLLLYSLIRLYRPMKVIEVGVSKGRSTTWLAAALKDNQSGWLISIDNFSRQSGGKADGPEYAEDRLRKAGLDRYATIIMADSHEWLPKQEALSADIVWVDGDHTYEGALQDIREALRIARSLVIVHDTRILPDVKRAVEDATSPGLSEGVFLQRKRGFWLYAKY